MNNILRLRKLRARQTETEVLPVMPPKDKPETNQKVEKNGLKDISNMHVAGVSHGYTNKVRRSSSSCMENKPKKASLVTTQANKISFRPGKVRRRSSVRDGKGLSIHAPGHVAPSSDYSPMDTAPPLMKIRSYMTRVPRGVTDIDGMSDHLNCSVYAQAIMDYLQAVEGRWSFPENYLLKSVEVTPSMRSVLVDWLIQVQVHLELSQSTLHLCVAIIDRVLCKAEIPLDVLQLISITCILLAAKINERYLPTIEELCHLTHDTYTRKQVLQMEKEVLRMMKFDFNIPNPITFLDRFLMVKPCAKKQLIQGMSMYLLDLSLTDAKFVHFPPSLLTASAIYLSRDLLSCKELWDSNFSYYTKYSERDLQKCCTALKKLLPHMHTSKLKGASKKYSSKDFQSISNHVCLSKFLQENSTIKKFHETHI